MTPQENLQKAKQEFNQLEKEKNEAYKLAYYTEVQPLLDLAKQKKEQTEKLINDKFADRVRLSNDYKHQAQKELDEFNLRQARKSNDGKYKEGTILCEWVSKTRSRYWTLSDKKGCVVIYDGTQEIQHKQYKTDRPDIGNKIIIVLKKDGSMGKTFVKLNDSVSGNWLPEGEIKNN